MLAWHCYAKIASFLVVTGFTICVMNWLDHWSRYFKKYRLVGTVTGLYCYPVSACSGMINKNATCTVSGMKIVSAFDEQFLVGRETDETFAVSSPRGTIKQYFCQQLRRIQALCNGHNLLLSSQDGETFLLPLQQDYLDEHVIHVHRAKNIFSALDMGDPVANWLNDKLQTTKLRLYQVMSEVACVVPGRSCFGNYTIAVQDSIDYINRTITMEPKLTAQYFRPNIILTGCRPLDEIKWSYIKVGKVCFQASGPDCRLISTSNSSERIDWKHSWELPPDMPINVRVVDGCNFTTYIGVNAKVLVEGDINIGDPVFAAY